MSAPNHRMHDMTDSTLVDDGEAGMRAVYRHLDAEHDAREIRRRFDLVMGQLTASQHELFALMSCGWTREEIMWELNLTKQELSNREKRLMKKVEKIIRENVYSPPPFRTMVERRVSRAEDGPQEKQSTPEGARLSAHGKTARDARASRRRCSGTSGTANAGRRGEEELGTRN